MAEICLIKIYVQSASVYMENSFHQFPEGIKYTDYRTNARTLIQLVYMYYLGRFPSPSLKIFSFFLSYDDLIKWELDRRSLLLSHSSLSRSRLIIGLFWSHIVAQVSTQCLPLIEVY